MKIYIKPEVNITEVETQNILTGSLDGNGTQGSLTPSGSQGASGGRAKGHNFESLWDESWDADEDEDE